MPELIVDTIYLLQCACSHTFTYTECSTAGFSINLAELRNILQP